MLCTIKKCCFIFNMYGKIKDTIDNVNYLYRLCFGEKFFIMNIYFSIEMKYSFFSYCLSWDKTVEFIPRGYFIAKKTVSNKKISTQIL